MKRKEHTHTAKTKKHNKITFDSYNLAVFDGSNIEKDKKTQQKKKPENERT